MWASPRTSDERTLQAITILRDLGTPLLIHQPSYSLFNRWIEDKLLTVLDEQGVGCIAFSPLGQGLLTDKYLDGVAPVHARPTGVVPRRTDAERGEPGRVRGLAAIAHERGQRMSQLAIAWGLDLVVTSVLLGASSVAQLDENLDALDDAPSSATRS